MANPRISRLIEGFLSAKKAQGRAEGTIKEYSINLKRFCEFVSDSPIKGITPDVVQDFMVYLREYKFTTYNSTQPATRRLSPKSIKNNWITLSSFFNWVMEDLDIENPLKMPRPVAREVPIIPLTTDEIKALLKACDSYHVTAIHKATYKAQRRTKWRDRAIIHVLYDTGIRVGELINMRVEDVDAKNTRIQVLGKGKKNRHVFYSQETSQAIWKYHLLRFPVDSPEPDDFVFAGQQHLYPMTRSSVGSMLRRLGEKTGIQDVHPHRFRHSFAVAWLRNGGDAFALQDMLGHESMHMTRKYVHLAQGDLKKIHKRASPISNMYKS